MYNLPPELEALFFRMQVVIGGRSALRWQTNLAGDKPLLSVFVINFVDGIRHRAFLVPKLTVPDVGGILFSVDSISGELAKVEMRCTGHLTVDTPTESSDDLRSQTAYFSSLTNYRLPARSFRRF